MTKLAAEEQVVDGLSRLIHRARGCCQEEVENPRSNPVDSARYFQAKMHLIIALQRIRTDFEAAVTLPIKRTK